MYQYKFTIITVCYNAEKYIKETIESVLKQNFQDYEYIIKDGKSKDSTLTIIHSMVEENDRFHVVSDTDQGIYDAMNQAVSLAKGEYVIFLNAGDCLTDNCMLKNVNEFIQKKPVDVAYGNILQIGNNGERLRKYGQICSKKWSIFIYSNSLPTNGGILKQIILSPNCNYFTWFLFEIKKTIPLSLIFFFPVCYVSSNRRIYKSTLYFYYTFSESATSLSQNPVHDLH